MTSSSVSDTSGTSRTNAASVFTEPRVGRGDDGDLRDLSERKHRLFDLRRGDVLTAANDHVVQAVRDGEEAVVVEHAHVAGVVPTVGVERTIRERVVRVSDAEVGTARQDLASQSVCDDLVVFVDQSDLDTGQWAPISRVPFPGGIVEHRARNRRMLGRAVRPHDGDAMRGGVLAEGDRYGCATETHAVACAARCSAVKSG